MSNLTNEQIWDKKRREYIDIAFKSYCEALSSGNFKGAKHLKTVIIGLENANEWNPKDKTSLVKFSELLPII